MKRTTGTLEQLRIAAPCGAAWDRMEGDERVRFCGACQKNVYNLSAMSWAEAEALVFQTEGRLCVRFHRRRDGTVLTDNCPVGLRKARTWMAAQMAGVTAVFAGLIALAPWASPERLRRNEAYQNLRHSNLSRQEPLQTIFNVLDPIQVQYHPNPFQATGELAIPLPSIAPPSTPSRTRKSPIPMYRLREKSRSVRHA